MTYYEIPLTANAQRFSVTLAGVPYQMQLIYRGATEGGWMLDLLDAAGNGLVLGVPLVAGADLLAPYPDLGIGGSLFVDAVPTYGNLGTGAHLYFGAAA